MVIFGDSLMTSKKSGKVEALSVAYYEISL